MQYRLTRRPMRSIPRSRGAFGGMGPPVARFPAVASWMTMSASPVHLGGTTQMAAAARLSLTGRVTIPLVVPFTEDELLDLLVTPRRKESFRYDVVDKEHNVLGRLVVTSASAPGITNDTSRAIRRQLVNVTIPPRPGWSTDDPSTDGWYYSDDIDTQQHRVRVWHVFGTYQRSLGVFMFSADPRTVRTAGETINAQLDDYGHIFSQQVLTSTTFPQGTNISVALAALYADVGLRAVIEATSATLAQPLTVVALEDSRQSIAESLCAAAGFLPPYFDNDGVGRCRPTPDYPNTTPSLVYGEGSRAYAGSIESANAVLVAPNTWVAESSGGTDVAIVGVYTLPNEDPHSVASIGYAIPERVDASGVDTVAAAEEAARAAGMSSKKRLRRRTWTSPIDSRHDTFDAVLWDGEVLVEQSWSMELRPGGSMQHDSVVVV